MKIIKTITVHLFTGANVAALLLLWLCCLASYVSPEAFPRISLLPLLFPAFLLLNLLFIIFWLIFKVKRVWLPIAGMALCFSFIRDYIPINPSFLQTSVTVDEPQSTLRILSYNTRCFGGSNSTDEEGRNLVVEYVAATDADIICLQEASGSKRNDLDKRMQELGFESYNHKGQAIYSRLHIIKTDTLCYPTRSNAGIQALLFDGQDTILFINNHFESNQLSDLIKDDYRDVIGNRARNAYEKEIRDTIRKELAPMINQLTKAAPLRAAQADSVQHIIQRWLPRPVIVCGDFNDTPVSYTLRILTRDLQSAFRQSGNGLGYTFHEKGFPVRIDHILFSPDHWQSRHTRVDNTISASDHYPILTELVRK